MFEREEDMLHCKNMLRRAETQLNAIVRLLAESGYMVSFEKDYDNGGYKAIAKKVEISSFIKLRT